MSKVSIYAGQSPTAHTVSIGDIDLVFSYSTIVAYRTRAEGWVVSENVWSVTTGKHLSQETPVDKKRRIPHSEFQTQLDALLARIDVAADATIRSTDCQ